MLKKMHILTVLHFWHFVECCMQNLTVLLRCMEEVKIYYFSKRGIQEVIKFIFAKKCEIGIGRGNIS